MITVYIDHWKDFTKLLHSIPHPSIHDTVLVVGDLEQPQTFRVNQTLQNVYLQVTRNNIVFEHAEPVLKGRGKDDKTRISIFGEMVEVPDFEHLSKKEYAEKFKGASMNFRVQGEIREKLRDKWYDNKLSEITAMLVNLKFVEGHIYEESGAI